MFVERYLFLSQVATAAAADLLESFEIEGISFWCPKLPKAWNLLLGRKVGSLKIWKIDPRKKKSGEEDDILDFSRFKIWPTCVLTYKGSVDFLMLIVPFLEHTKLVLKIKVSVQNKAKLILCILVGSIQIFNQSKCSKQAKQNQLMETTYFDKIRSSVCGVYQDHV